MNSLSEGWPSKYNPDKRTRRTDEQYAEHSAQYTETSSRLGYVRNCLINLATEAGIQPPLTRQDVRFGKRNDEITQWLGSVGSAMLAEHVTAVDANQQAMSDLRDEACALEVRINATIC